MGHSPEAGRQAGDRKELAWFQAWLPGTGSVGVQGREGRRALVPTGVGFIPDGGLHLLGEKTRRETDSAKESRQRRKHHIAGAGQELDRRGVLKDEQDKQSKL